MNRYDAAMPSSARFNDCCRYVTVPQTRLVLMMLFSRSAPGVTSDDPPHELTRACSI